MRDKSWKERDNEHMKRFFSSSARVINVTLKTEPASQFQESNVQDAKCRAKIKSATETALRPDEASFKNAADLCTSL